MTEKRKTRRSRTAVPTQPENHMSVLTAIVAEGVSEDISVVLRLLQADEGDLNSVAACRLLEKAADDLDEVIADLRHRPAARHAASAA